MNLIIKTRGSQPIDERDKKWAEAKFKKLARLIPKETIVEVVLEDMYGPKRGQDKKVHVSVSLPNIKEPFHLEEVDLKFRKAITRARDRFVRYLNRQREKNHTPGREAKKFWVGRLFDRFRRNGNE